MRGKGKILILMVSVLCILVLSGCEKNYSKTEQYFLTIDAESIEKQALEYFGLKKNQADEIQSRLTEEHDRIIYDVNFKVGEKEYSIKADAGTGTILSGYDGEEEFRVLPSDGHKYFGQELSMKKALQSVGLNLKDVDAILNVLDVKNNEYKVQYYYQGEKHTIVIHALTGEILE